MEGREDIGGGGGPPTISPPSCFSVILQKGLAHAQLSSGGSSPSDVLMQQHEYMNSMARTGGGGGGGGGGAVMEQVKRRRGRPRKYGPTVDGSMGVFMNSHHDSSPSQSQSQPQPQSLLHSQKKVRGRPLGSGKKQQLAALGTAGVDFTPHVITVAAGEDVAMKVMSFSQQQGPQAVCILSANGAISNATLRQPSTSGGMVTYEGCFEILSFSGSFLPIQNAGITSRTGGLSVCLAAPGGQVLGGGVAGLLMAAGPVQVILGTFLFTDSTNELKAANTGSSATKPHIVNLNSAMQHNHTSMGTSMHWTVSDIMPDIMRNTDINVSLPGG